MYVGTTTAGRPDHFIILEKGDKAKSVLALMTEKKVKNLIISKEIKDDQFLGNPDFKDIFDQIEILHLNKIEIKESQQIYAFKNLRRLEISDCTYKTKEPIDFLQFMKLEEVVMLYSKRFVHLFNHPKLKLIMLNNFNELDFSYPENHVIETLSIEKSKACNWNSLIHLKNLKSLYLIGIPSLKDISFISQLSYLTDIEFSSCKNTLNTIKKLAEVKTLESIFLYGMGNVETLTPLQKLKQLKELTIENGGFLTDKKSVSFLHKIPNLEFTIEMKNCYYGNNG